jgi:RimJ/RimL family protein N-acetyltransferase
VNYKVLNKQIFTNGDFSIVPIRYEDRIDIMTWRNEQIYHLRQNKPLTIEDQENYFTNVVAKLFEQEQPGQILFSYLKNEVCIGYGGLVHINWIDKNAEISFVMNTELEQKEFQLHWTTYLSMIAQAAFEQLHFKKIYTFAFDLRPHLYPALESAGFRREAVLKDHCLFDGNFKDVVIHSKFNQKRDVTEETIALRDATIEDAELLFDWANETGVRQNSINQEPIILENHLKWFAAKLSDSETKILILTSGHEHFGQIRIDFTDGYWTIDYSIDSQFRGLGLGKEIVRQLLKKFPEYKFKATVKKENHASGKVFKNLGFNRLPSVDADFDFFEYNPT